MPPLMRNIEMLEMTEQRLLFNFITDIMVAAKIEMTFVEREYIPKSKKNKDKFEAQVLERKQQEGRIYKKAIEPAIRKYCKHLNFQKLGVAWTMLLSMSDEDVVDAVEATYSAFKYSELQKVHETKVSRESHRLFIIRDSFIKKRWGEYNWAASLYLQGTVYVSDEEAKSGNPRVFSYSRDF